MSDSVNEVHSRVKYEFDDSNLNIRIVSDIFPWRFILPDPNLEVSTMNPLGVDSLLEIQCNKNEESYLFDYRIVRKEDSCQLGPTFKFKTAHHEANLLWGSSTILILTEELVYPEKSPSEITISIFLPSNQAEYFSQLKVLNKSISVRQVEYVPSGTPLFGKKENIENMTGILNSNE